MLRLFFGRQLGRDACRRLVSDARARAETELAEFRGIRNELAADGSADAPYILLTVLAGEHSARATLAWTDEALGILDAIPETTAVPG